MADEKVARVRVCVAATFPDQHPETSPQHAIVLNYKALPGVVTEQDSMFAPFNLGVTLVHEAGHYFGLAHTFNSNTCSGDNDGVPDTPVERSPASGCPVNPPRDSCPSQPGLDPVRNFMDYSDDACMTSGFTPLQVTHKRV